MGRAAAQVLVLTVRVMVVAVLIPVSKARAIKTIRVVIINNLVRGLSSSNSRVMRVIRSS